MRKRVCETWGTIVIFGRKKDRERERERREDEVLVVEDMTDILLL